METERTPKHPVWRNICAAMLALLGFFAAQTLTSVFWMLGYVLYQHFAHAIPVGTAFQASADTLLAHQCLVLIIASALFLIVLALIFRKKHSSLALEVHFSRFNPLLFLLFMCAGLATNLLVAYLLSVIPFPESWLEGYESASSYLTREIFPIRLAAIAILGPITEEVVFRGMVFLHFRRIMPRALAIILESILFGLFHGQAIWILYGAAMGVLLTVVMDKTDNLAYSVAAHIGFNLLGLI